MLIGLVSDTHGLVRPEALAALDGVELILHAGDVGGELVLAAFRRVAPVSAVYGNTDDPDAGLPAALDLTLGGLSVHVSHGHEAGAPTPERLAVRCDADVIVFGHTHRAIVHRVGHRLLVNPGAAGPRRFNLKPSVGLLRVADGAASAEIVYL